MINYNEITDIELDGIDSSDYPDFSDAYIVSAYYKGKEMTEKELDYINEDGSFINEQVFKHFF